MIKIIKWADERELLLRKLWADGLSASQIAAELGGVTRNAVIGKVHRLKLKRQAKDETPPTLSQYLDATKEVNKAAVNGEPPC